MSINNINEVLKEEIKRVSVGKEEYKYLNEISRLTIKEIEKRLKKLKINASVFIGGSLAKETVVKKEKHDIDLFLRFDKKYPEPQINRFMRKIFFLFKVPGFKAKVKKIHGSRDYVQIIFKKHGVMIEVVPSIKIANPEEARNITDLSYFHIKYVNDKIKKHKKLSDEIILAKAFCHAQKCYGAESYINGFSGYALELLIINCGTFDKFKDACRRFLNNPSIEHFEHKKVSIDKMRNYAMEIEGAFAVFHVETNKQEGDIAGTKLLKFHSFLGKELEKNFDIIEQHFEYDYGKDSYNYFIIKRKKEIVIYGPALNYKEGVENFKKTHRIWYIQDGKICAAKSPEITVKQFLKEFNRRNKTQMKQMEITKVALLKNC